MAGVVYKTCICWLVIYTRFTLVDALNSVKYWRLQKNILF